MINTLYKQFQYWSRTGSVYILSDTHFDDEDTKLMDVNWITPEEQIKIINKLILPSDTFVCLGDVGAAKYIDEICARYKVLILGNHDKKSDYKDKFNEIYEGPLFISEKILLSHEPIDYPYGLNIHGHDHSGQSFNDDRHLNLAANVCGYIPYNLGKGIKNGILSNIQGIHRAAIERQKIFGIET